MICIIVCDCSSQVFNFAVQQFPKVHNVAMNGGDKVQPLGNNVERKHSFEKLRMEALKVRTWGCGGINFR